LLEKIRALSRSVSVVLMSGGHAEAKARMAGAAAFLSKPIMPETLRATVTALSARFPEQT
jgi:DNA-binding response OmpR family regulator